MSIVKGLPGHTVCPCGSGQTYASCCAPFHSGVAAPTAEKLMRSRYTAFVIGDLDYIERTSSGPARLRFKKADLALSLPQTEWLGLNILDRQQGLPDEDVGFVRFQVRYREKGRVLSQTERSEFRRIEGAWAYWDGQYAVEPQPGLVEKIGRNDPCHCGSGKKFKKCCGA